MRTFHGFHEIKTYSLFVCSARQSFLQCPVSVDCPENANTSAAEEADDDEDLPDFITLKINTDDPPYMAALAKGTTHASFPHFGARWSKGSLTCVTCCTLFCR